jgi:hypothetical protein
VDSHRIEHRDEADAAIDRAIREIMSAEPAWGFRARVLRRIAREPAAPGWTWLQLGLTAAGVALALILVIWPRPAPHPAAPDAISIDTTSRTAPPPPTKAPRAPSAAAAAKGLSKVPPPRAVRSAPSRSTSASRLVRAASIAGDDLLEDAIQVESPEPQPDMGLAAIEPAATVVPPIVVTPIPISAIVIAPLRSDGR